MAKKISAKSKVAKTKRVRRILVTAALPYANGPIHIGHLLEYISTDIFVRALKLLGEDVIYVCASDTHGTPIEVAAMKKGVLPAQLISDYHKEHFEDFKSFYINFDSFYSTDSPENKKFSDLFFAKLKENGLIYQKVVEQTFCEKCQRFLPDRYVKGKCPKCNAPDQYGDVCESCRLTYTTTDLVDPYCVICGSGPVRKESKQYFFKLSACSKKLEKWLNGSKNLQPEIKNYVLNWIKEGLKDWCISRDGPYFGFKIPGEVDKYYYVWLDAPIGYIASTENYCKKTKLDVLRDYWQSKNTKIIHFIGKDIIYFHYLFWPAILMEVGFNLPEDIIVHGMVTVNGEKMSKSRGNFFTAKDFLNYLEPEHLRFYYASHLNKKIISDVDINFREFMDEINNKLVANLSNFCFRVLTFIQNQNNGLVKEVADDKRLKAEVKKKIKLIEGYYREFNLKDAVKEILLIGDIGNRYFQKKEPWKEKDLKRVDKTLGLCLNIVRILGSLISPVMPVFAANLQKQINVADPSLRDLDFSLKNHRINKPAMLVKKIEVKDLPVIGGDFPLNLVVAKIIEVREHPDADKLYILKLDIGEKLPLQIIAGIRKSYKPSELQNRHIVVLSNLKPVKLRGYDSSGMLLVGRLGDVIKLLEAPNCRAGDKVFVDGMESSKKIISLEEFEQVQLKVRNNKVYYKDRELKIPKGVVFVPIADGAQVC